MDESNNYHDLTVDYVSGRLSVEQRRDCETLMARDSELAREISLAAQMDVGITLLDRIQADHVDSLNLVVYAQGPEELDQSIRGTLEEHLRECSSCRNELAECRTALSANTDTPEIAFDPAGAGERPQVTPIGRVFKYAASVAAVIILVAGTYFVTQLTGPSEPTVAVYELSSGTERSLQAGNEIVLDSDVDLVRLELLLPTLEGRDYDYAVVDSKDKTVFELPDQRHQLPIVLDIPVTYLASDDYTIWVTEQPSTSGESSRLDTIKVYFRLNRLE